MHSNPSLVPTALIEPTGGNWCILSGLQRMPCLACPDRRLGLAYSAQQMVESQAFHVVLQEAEARRAATAARRAENRQRRRAAAMAVQESAGLSQGEGGVPRRLGAAKAREPTMYEWLQVGAAAEQQHPEPVHKRARATGARMDLRDVAFSMTSAEQATTADLLVRWPVETC